MVNLNWQKYPVYKSSGVEWLGDIPEHWEVKKLKYFVTINSEVLSEDTPPEYEIEYIDIGNVNEFGIVNVPQKIIFSNSPSRARRIVKQNDTLISTVRSYLKAIAFIKENKNNLIASTGFAVLRPNTKTCPKYLSYLISSHSFISCVVANSKGVSYPAITPLELGNLKVPIAVSEEEQQAIANFLDEKTAQIDEYIAKKQRIIELLKEQKTVIINQAVTKGINPDVPMKYSGIKWLGEIPEHWEVKKLKFIVLKIGSGKTPKGGGNVYSDSGVVFLRSQNIHFDRLRLDDVVYINQLIDSKMASTRVKTNDVLLNIIGASLGRCQIIPKNFPPANVNQNVCIIRPNRKFIEPSFLFGIMASNAIQAQIFSSENGSSQEALNFLQIANFTLGMPPEISEQKEIALFIEKKLEKIERSLTVIEKEIKLTQEYRTSLISETVTGKIDVRKYHPPQ